MIHLALLLAVQMTTKSTPGPSPAITRTIQVRDSGPCAPMPPTCGGPALNRFLDLTEEDVGTLMAAAAPGSAIEAGLMYRACILAGGPGDCCD